MPPRAATYVWDMYGAGHDFPACNAPNPCLEYMLAAVPRSGSTYLAVELWRTGVMGAPMEYANPQFRDVMRWRFDLTGDLLAYWRELKRHRASPNGVFGFKMFIPAYITEARENPEFLKQLAPAKVIFLTRSDLVAQAVSYSKAIRSGVWFHGVREKTRATYDAEDIHRCIVMLQHQVDFWNELFALTKTTVYHVTYEDLLDDKDAVVKGVAEFLGVELMPQAVLNLPYMRIQRDTESAEWVQKYKEEQSKEMSRFGAEAPTQLDAPAKDENGDVLTSTPQDARIRLDQAIPVPD